MNDMFITIVGVIFTIIGILAIAVLFSAFIWVRVLHYPLHLYFKPDKEDKDEEDTDTD